MWSRRYKRKVDKGMREVAESFSKYLTVTHQDRLPRPGFYVMSNDGFQYLEGETEERQERRCDEITEDTVFGLGVYAEAIGPEDVEVSPRLIVVPGGIPR